MFDEFLSSEETEGCRVLLEELRGAAWCAGLVERLSRSTKLTRDQIGFMFELRFAAALNRPELSPKYEVSCGVGDSTVDFRASRDGTNWFIELASVTPSAAVQEATNQFGPFIEASLSSESINPRQSMAGEMILLQQKVGEKVWRAGSHTKFASPVPGVMNVIIVDVRGFALGSHDVWDYLHIAYGPAGVANAPFPAVQYFRSPDGTDRPVAGLFDEDNGQRFAFAVRERIHFIGFALESTYDSGSLPRHLTMLPNLRLFDSVDDINRVIQTFPLDGVSFRAV